MFSRREFLQWAAVTTAATGYMGSLTRVAAQQRLTQDDLLKFDSKGSITLLHFTDVHAQLKPVYFRPPSENYGVGAFEGIPPHLVGEEFLSHFGIKRGSPLAYAHTMVDYVDMARTYGRLGGLDRTATLVKAIRAERGDSNVLFLDGGDTWQGSYTSLKTNGQDMVDCMKLLKPDAMVGHWEFTFGEDRVKEIVDDLGYPFLASNVFDTEWDEPVFEHTAFYETGGHKVAVIGQAMPYTPIANPRWMIPNWSFGIRPEVIQANVDAAREAGAAVVVLLSHNGFDVDQKLATVVNGIDVILTGHTHDAVPEAIKIGNTLLLSSGSHGKYLGRVDLEVKDGRVTDYNSALIPVFSDVIDPDPEMAAKIDEVRAPYEAECNRVIGKTSGLLYRRGNFNGTWDDLICQGIMEERDAELAFSPGFRWGTTLLPGDDITIDDLYNQTSMNYPSVYRLEFTGTQIKEILEDVCDNLFNKDPFFQQGGDMVRVGGMAYSCAPKESIGNRISNMTMIKTGEPIEADRSYVVAGWASVNEGVEGPAVYDLMENYITRHKVIDIPRNDTVKVIGMN
ncbi:MAG: thiosulfohydrolase SoxB [Thalassospira sp.]|uniref:thiosulfohydrolase SoxB n=1 Tax=unclassified Thalassospira TaxID=2648997 RepID=UPI000C68E6ED|nr:MULTISPECIES: thiosulfohydrolase SoxB [unclassified Thalassospira]MBE72027.1 thiosulfohydrolase SoxB [Thalassospira sp.]QPO13544.1 thiosulfohydrolase SoxB [Thalassospira sp. A40-3]|tara:strand:- start:333 stop:2027 length:1695 start_codon:yes stop_codon:yes gene_type:complete